MADSIYSADSQLALSVVHCTLYAVHCTLSLLQQQTCQTKPQSKQTDIHQQANIFIYPISKISSNTQGSSFSGATLLWVIFPTDI